MTVSGLMVAAGTWQAYRIYQNIKLKNGVLTIDSENAIRELNEKRKHLAMRGPSAFKLVRIYCIEGLKRKKACFFSGEPDRPQ